MPLQFSPYVLVSGSAALALTVLAIYLWPRRTRVASILPFEMLLIGLVFWICSDILELSSTTLAAKDIFLRFLYIGLMFALPGWFTFALAYTGREKWLNRPMLLALSIHPVLLTLATFTNDWHHLFWSSRELIEVNGLIVSASVYGPLFWVHAVYSYLLMLGGTVLLISAFVRAPELYRGQVVWLLIGSFTPWVANIIYIFDLSPLPDFIDLTPMALTITALALGYSVLRFSLLDIVPVARGAVIDGIADTVLVLDNQGRIVDINPAGRALIERPADQIIGQPISALLVERTDLLEQFADVEQAQTELALTIRGEPREYNLTISALKNTRGDLMGRVVLLHEITALKKIARELAQARTEAEEASRLKSQFLATMSHELRTPLNAINGFTELMLEGMSGELTMLQRQNLTRVLTNATDLRRLIDDLLDLSRIEAGQMDLVTRPFELKSWLDEVIKQTQSLASEKGLKYEARIDTGLPERVEGDPARLKQIVLNLISNAIKFTEKGTVRVEAALDGKERWQIRVSDTGIGIPPHALGTIFETFRQLDSTPARKHGGSGLGLSITRSLVVAMGGAIRVESKVGEGSTFTVTLPLTAVEKAAGGA